MKPPHIPYNRWATALLVLFIIIQKSATLQADTGHSLYVGKFSAENPAEALPNFFMGPIHLARPSPTPGTAKRRQGPSSRIRIPPRS